MLKKAFAAGAFLLFIGLDLTLDAHCQMPCGIYHDDMIYDQIDQFVETVYKGISVMNDSKFSTVKEKNEFVRWVMQKEKACNEAAELILRYFLQQKIKPDEDDTVKRLVSAHKLLFMLMTIKQNTDLEFIKQFNAEWEKFKLMFHREGYECEMEKKEFRELDILRKAQEAKAQDEAGIKVKPSAHHHSE
jgi:nickel superoxide dismutase